MDRASTPVCRPALHNTLSYHIPLPWYTWPRKTPLSLMCRMARVTWPRGIPCGIKGHKTSLHNVQCASLLSDPRASSNILHYCVSSATSVRGGSNVFAIFAHILRGLLLW